MKFTNSINDLHLDIVGFLAILGEGSISATSNVSCLSRLSFLPRLIPAPHVLLRPTRPARLPETDATVTGVYSLNNRATLQHVASVLLDIHLKPYTVRYVNLTKRSPNPVKARSYGVLPLVTLLGTLTSLALLITSIKRSDGMSLLATLLLSLLSTLAGISNHGQVKLPHRSIDTATDPGDVVVRFPNGAFLVVQCAEELARELFFAPEAITYSIRDPHLYRLLSLVGTLLLMGGVIFLGNATTILQLCWAGAYVVLNIAYWFAAAVPMRWHWDLSCYAVKELGIKGGAVNETFTDALWKVLCVTKNCEWADVGDAAPKTTVWNGWMEDAVVKASEAGWVKETPGRVGSMRWEADEKVFDVPEWDAGKALLDRRKASMAKCNR